MSNMIVGAQLFTVRDYLKNEVDFARSLEKVAKIGYRAVQLSGMSGIAPQRVRELCDEFGLTVALTHNNPDRLRFDIDAVIEENEIYGSKYIGLGGIPPRYCSEEWIKNFIEDYREPAEKVAAAGKRFLYHHHAFDFRKFDGKRQIEYILEGFSPKEMGITLDTYWVQMAGADMFEWAEKLQDRIPCVHLKDMSVQPRVFDNIPMMMAVGEGNMNMKGFLELLEQMGKTEYILAEQDICPEDPFRCLEKSYQNLKKMGY